VAAVSPTGPPQTCASCWIDKGAPAPAVPGQTQVTGGVQVLRVDLVEGYYRPNRFTVQAGVPVEVVFTGWAEDCLGHPEFPELGVKGDLSTTGRAVFPLGPLEPGTYTFTCEMGVNEGRITVE
jgi:plastocyanin domain-containing protein